MRVTSLGLVVLVALLLGAAPGPLHPGSSAATPAASLAFGDLDCGGGLGIGDAQKLARSLIGLAVTQGDGCPAMGEPVGIDGVERLWGDVDCGGSLGIGDAQKLARSLIGLQVTQGAGCPAIGAPVEIGPPAPLSPQELAARLHAATDTAQAEALLRRVYPELGVGLYTEDGQQILAGVETGPDDFYLYDAESELLARNYVERQLFGLHTATLFLEEAGVVDADSGQPLSDADVLSRLADGVAAARADESQFTWRLIDELGLVQEDPLDLAAAGLDPATTYLDSVQTFLVLYDMTLGLPVPAGASAEVLSAAGGPNARTQALHDYSLLAQGFVASVDPVAPTHWKHDASSVAEERTLEAQVSWVPGAQVTRGFTAGPLRLVAIPSALGAEPADVSWVSSGLLKNGAWKKLENSDRTGEIGDASIVFVPKTEPCPGKGSVQTETPTVFVIFVIQVKSAFFPHRSLGSISKVVKTGVEVSRHTAGGGASAGGPAPLAASGATSATDPSEGLPCAYEGHASATHDELGIGVVTYTTTASDLRFQLQPPDPAHPGGATYKLVQGTVTVQVTGEAGDCTISGGYTIAQPMDDGVHIFGGSIAVDPQNNRYAAAGGVADYEQHVFINCPDQPPVWLGTVGHLWVSTTNVPPLVPNRSFTPGDVLQGSFDTAGNPLGWTSHYEWSFEPILCEAGGPAGAASAPDLAQREAAGGGTC
ncbi:MAG: hypothetical protein Q7T33_08970 [Dehalococcoidia bacterium]|nr:hypothetical protein [Dehalococcoidia bacterium]